jgi:methylmalonyl-CoA/ethylmalonyl-CoA epimerase
MLEANKVSLKLDEIGQITIPVRDLERAIGFYRDALGMDFLFQASPGLAFFDCGGICLMLDVPAGTQSDNLSSSSIQSGRSSLGGHRDQITRGGFRPGA